MSFLTKSLVRKFFLLFLFFGALLFAPPVYLKYKLGFVFPEYVFLVVAGVFAIIILILVVVMFTHPLKVILREIQALLSGKGYKKIYTSRVDEIGVLAFFFNKVTSGFSGITAEIREKKRMQEELGVAAEIQSNLLPLQTIHVPGLQIAAKNKPASELGGDIFDFITVNKKTYIYVGDVTGHGAAAALLMTMANSFINIFADSCPGAYEILVKVNEYLKRKVKKAMFLTLVMLSFDHATSRMSYVGAGHEHILIYHAKTGECSATLSGGMALGMLPDNSKAISEKDLNVEDGDFVILYSDGITEARNKEGELYGLENIRKAVLEYAPTNKTAEGLNYHIAKDVSRYMSGHIQDDDMTLIVVKVDSTISGKEESAEDSVTWNE